MEFYNILVNTCGLREKTYNILVFCPETQLFISLQLVSSYLIENNVLDTKYKSQKFRIKCEGLYANYTFIVSGILNVDKYDFTYNIKDEDSDDYYIIV